VAFAVGPEGGFSAQEISLACSLGWQPALIGPRVLRTETAGLVAITLANAASGDMSFR
jgi:16S rRNA (uracil1498-N3)-methyltransferase